MRRNLFTLFLVLVTYAGGIAVTFIVFQDWTARQTIAVILTGAVVIWYTWETMLLRQIALVQREQQLRPFVLFKGGADGYKVENVGATPALSVEILPVVLEREGIDFRITFPSSVPLLRPNEELPIAVEVTLNGTKIDSIYAAHLDQNYAVEAIDVVISFRSIEGKPYRLIQTTAPNNTDIKGFHHATA